MNNRGKLPGYAIVAIGLVLFLLAAIFIAWRASRALSKSAEEVTAEREIRFTTGVFRPAVNTGFTLVSAPAVFEGAAVFQGHLYIAGPAGLFEYDLEGTPERQFAAGQELQASPIVAIAPGFLADAQQAELILATADRGILAFDGQKFREIVPENAEFREITSILPVENGHLLFGTKQRGVLIYDGKRIAPLHGSLSGVYVQALAGAEADLWVGTIDRGVLHWHGGTTERFGEGEGLPDRRVDAIAIDGEKTYAGTPLGVAEFDGGRFARVLAEGVLTTALEVARGNLLVGSEDQGVLSIPLKARTRAGGGSRTGALDEVRQFLTSDDATYVLTRDGLYQMNARGLGQRRVLQPGPAVLTDRNISAVAVDEKGTLWVGYFDRGLDQVLPDGSRARHIEDEHVFCINKILPDTNGQVVNVATANGLVRFGASGNEEQVLTRADGLIADHVTDVVTYRNGLAVATPAGVTFLDASGARSLYAFQGLVNNHVYSLGVSGDELMVGTLGGLSEMEKEVVQANYTAGNSGLKHNWITAVVPVGEDWMLGTYGAGVVELDRSGRFHSFETATGKFEINPNAMVATPDLVLAGSLGNGLYVYDRASGRWSVVEAGLPSRNVTALAVKDGTIYVGTDNGLVKIREGNLRP